MYRTLKFILSHPLGRLNKIATIRRYLQWQFGSRIVPGPVAVEFVNNSRLLVTPGMTGATGNIYCGLHEFEDMMFLLHFLRSKDSFVDVGANVGTYTILASGVVGCHTKAFEPVPKTYGNLVDNVCLNRVEQLVDACLVAVGRENGELEMTSDLDTVNHFVAHTEKYIGKSIKVSVQPLSDCLENVKPVFMKIDVEGYETEVIAGMGNILVSNELQVILMELNGSGKRYGFDETTLHRKILDSGFRSYQYNPFERTLQDLSGEKNADANTLYIKDFDAAARRVAGSPAYRVMDFEI